MPRLLIGLALSIVFGFFVPSLAKGTPGVVQENWTKLKGGEVRALTESKQYTRPANTVRILDEFSDTGWGQEYGSRYSALLIPPATGKYTFWLAADNSAELWLSTDQNSSNLRKIISVKRYTKERDWSRRDQKSAPILLKKGQRYYIQALHKQAGSKAHLSVAWQRDQIEKEVIVSKFLDVPALDKRTLSLAKKTQQAERRTAQLLEALKTMPPEHTEAWVTELSKPERTQVVAALTTLGQAAQKNPTPENLSKIKPYIAAAQKLMPSPEAPISDPILKELLLLENLYINTLSETQLTAFGAHRTAAVLGSIPADVKPLEKTVTLRSGANKGRSEMLSTGLYALPGKPFTLTVPQSLLGKKVTLQIGHHLNAKSKSKTFESMPQTTKKIELTQENTTAVSPFGGMLFILIPKDLALAPTPVSFSGVIESPRFILGETTDAEWETLRNNPAPWGELVGKNIIFIVHREALQALDHPQELMSWWDDNVRAHEGFYNYDIGIPLRIHTCLNPVMGVSTWPLYEKKETIVNLLNLPRMKAYNDGLFLHEHGHHCDDKRMMFTQIGESTCNWAGYYMKGTRGDFNWKDTEEMHLLRLFDPSDEPHQHMITTEKWWTTKFDSHYWSYPLTSVMIGYAQSFGWEAFKTVVHRFTHPDDPINQLPAYAKSNLEDQDKIDLWLIFLSQEAQHDIRPYFAHFHLTASNTANQLIDSLKLPKWDAVFNPTQRVLIPKDQPVELTHPLKNALAFSKDLTLHWTQKPAHGKLSTTNGRLTYTPEPGFTGSDKLPYIIENTYGNSFDGCIEIHVVSEKENPKFVLGSTAGVSSTNWTPILFPQHYRNPVVLASIDPEANPDFIVRIRNVKPTGCEIKLQPIRENSEKCTGYDAQWVVIESGTFTPAQNGILAIAGTVEVTPEKTSPEVEGIFKPMGNHIPLLRTACFGQVQTFNNPEWNRFFWHRDPDHLGIRVGTHYGFTEEPHKKETVGYLCISPGIYQFGNRRVTIRPNQIKSEGLIFKTEFTAFNQRGFGKTERYFR